MGPVERGEHGFREVFAPEDWARVVGAPMLAGIAVTAAEPGGLWGAVKESAAVAGALRAGRAGGEPADRRDRRRLRDLRGPRPGARRAEGRGARQGAGGGGRRGGGRARRGGGAGRREGARGGAGLQGLAERDRRQGGGGRAEGGFLGFGGEKVSAAEQATLDRLATALG